MSTYTIKWGDTLSGIAKNNNTDINTLMNLNPYITNANKIYAGKTLQLPDAVQPQPVQVQQPVVQPQPVQPAQQPTQQLAEEYAKQQTVNVGNEGQALLSQYEKIAEAQKQALQKQQELTNTQINSQRDDVMDTYHNNARQAYINSMLGKKQVEQQLSQAGLNTSGLVGSAYANVENAYGNNLANLQGVRDKSIQNINKQLNESQIQYAIQEQKLLSDIENAKMDLQKYNNELAYKKYQDAINNYMSFNNFDYTKSRDAVEDSRWQQEFDYKKEQDRIAQDNWLKEYNLALKKANASSSRSSSSRTSNNNSKISDSLENTTTSSFTSRLLGNENEVNTKTKEIINIAKNGTVEGQERAKATLDKYLQQIQDDYNNGLISKEEKNRAQYIFDYR